MVNRPKIKKKKLLLISILSLVLVIGAIVSTYALTMANTVKVTSVMGLVLPMTLRHNHVKMIV